MAGPEVSGIPLYSNMQHKFQETYEGSLHPPLHSVPLTDTDTYTHAEDAEGCHGDASYDHTYPGLDGQQWLHTSTNYNGRK